MKRVILLGVIMLAMFLNTPVLALGVAIGPPTLEINNAVRGGEYERGVIVTNPI